MKAYDKNQYQIDFSNHSNLTDDEKVALYRIQEQYNPIERADLLLEYKAYGKITEDEYGTMTGLPFNYDY